MHNRVAARLFASFFSLIILAQTSLAQVKIGSNPSTINSNSILELESSNKGFLPPRVAINDVNSVSPLSGTVTAGMLVYSTGGTVADGYYYWNGSSWTSLSRSRISTRTSTATITKSESIVLASNNILLTLPAVTSADEGLTITVKNVGTHTDLVTVKAATAIDGSDSINLTRWKTASFIVHGNSWMLKNKESVSLNILDVSATGSWTTITEAIEFLEAHMTAPAVIRLDGGSFEIGSTIIIDLDYPVTIQGTSFGKTTISPASGLSGPLFRAQTEAYFKMLMFDGNVVAGYSSAAGNDAIQVEGSGEYFEVKDCDFDGFNKAVAVKTNAELWIFETDINNVAAAGIEIAAGINKYVTLKVSEVDFISCNKGISLVSGDSATVSILNSTFYNTSSGTGTYYNPTLFTNFSSMFVTNNAWNGKGMFFDGFDFSRADGRDARAFLQNNAGDPNRNPSCHITVLNSTATTTVSSSGWIKAAWSSTATTVETTKWNVANSVGGVNRITFLPTNRRNGYFIISGNLTCTQSNRTISLGIVKNGASTTRFGETTIRTAASNTPTLFSTVVYVTDISKNDYFELFISDVNGSNTVTIQDLQWFADTK